jgi:acyl carrier protein
MIAFVFRVWNSRAKPALGWDAMKTSERLFFIAFGAVATFIASAMLRDWLRKRRATSSLTTRTQHADEQFGRAFFSDPKRADIAVRVRRVLSSNLKMPLDGLTPSDRLNEDLDAELPANPHLFWELEAEFKIKTGIDDLETFEKVLESLVTFQDLVQFVETKSSEPTSERLKDDEAETTSRTYGITIRSIPVLCITGFVTAIIGIIIQKKTLMNLGGLIFLSGFVVWGFANGGEMLRSIIRGVRGTSIKEIVARPWPLILLTSLSLFFLWVGGFLLWGILKNLLSSK